MKNYKQNNYKSQKKPNMKKSKRSRRKAPMYLYLLPIAVDAGIIYFSKDIGKALISSAVVLLAAYLLITVIWRVHYLLSLGGADIKDIDTMSGEEFEDWLAMAYKKRKINGAPAYSMVETTPKTCDYGADLLVKTLDGRKVVIQCKRYRKNVPESAVQQVISAREYYKCDKAIVVTNSQFTDAAKNLAKKTDVILIDRYKLGTKAMYDL